MTQPTQVCDRCQMELPLTAAYYHRKRDSPTGFRTTCNVCRGQERAMTSADSRRGKDLESKIKEVVEDAEESAVKALQALVPRQGSRIPHQVEVYESVMAAMGGPDGLASQLAAQFLAAGPGSKVRQQCLNAILKMSSEVSAAGNATKPLDLMTDEELAELINQQALELASSNPQLLKEAIKKASQKANAIEGHAEEVDDTYEQEMRDVQRAIESL